MLARREAFRNETDPVKPALARYRTEIANVATADPVLISGRAAWRRLAKIYQALPEGGDLCSELAAWRARGYDRATVDAASDESHAIFATSGRGWGRKTAAAADRMRELGVPEELAKRFEDG